MNVVIINSSDIFEYRVNLIYEILKEDGHQVSVIASDFMHIEKKYRTIENADFELIFTLPYKKNLSLSRLHSHYKFSKDAYRKIIGKKIDLLYIVVPPNSQAMIAKRFKKKNTKIIMDIIDLWPESLPLSFTNKFPFTLWANIRNKHLKYADYVITECNLYQEKLKKYLDKNKTTTLYWSSRENNIETNPCIDNNKIILCYLGSINNIIDIAEIGRIIRLMVPQKPVLLKIIGDGERRNELIQTAKDAGAQVIFYGKIYDQIEKQRIFDTCHFGLNIMKKEVCVGLSMKSIDYFKAGLPIINNLKGDIEELISTNKLGINVDENFQLIIKKNLIQENIREEVRKAYDKYFSFETFKAMFKEIYMYIEE